MKMKLYVLASLFFGITSQLYSQGYVVPDGVTYASYGSGYEIHVLQNPTNGNYTGFGLPGQGMTPPSNVYTNTFMFYPLADEGVRAFLVSFNDPISLQAIQTAGYSEMTYPNTYIFEEGAPFYVGLYTGEGVLPGGIYPNPLFGWAQLVNNGGVIQLLDSALVYGADGIYTGTQNFFSVPEPSTLSFVGLGLLGLGWYQWRKARA